MIGIDLGTTFSAVATVNELGKPEILSNREGESITPSVVLFQEDSPLVGTMAKRSAVVAPLDTVQFVKRQMGDPTWRFETSNGVRYRPEEISAIILRRLKEDAELALGEPVTEAVITVPAYFDDSARRATMDAGAIAGLTVPRVLNEPTAAALAYGVEHPTHGTVLVYDLGGGTFDVTVMRIDGGEFETLATNGDRNLGGFNWDNELMHLLNQRFRDAGGPDLLDDEQTEADLRDKAELVKRSLTTIARTQVVLAAGGRSVQVPVTRAEFEQATAGLLGRTRDLTNIVLEDAGLRWSDIASLLLAGGSTRMPMVRALMEEAAGQKAERAVNPDEVVAYGAAIQASLLARGGSGSGGMVRALRVDGAPIAISDVTSQGLGTVVLDPVSERQRNAVIIPANTRIPAHRSDRFSTVVDNQTEILVQVTQGDDEDPEYVRHVGEQRLSIPPYPAGSPVEISYAYDFDQLISIEVVDLVAGRSLGSFAVNNVANMDAATKAAATTKIQALEVG
ncbi:MAG TPA: Hsp70 family protein [Pseudonocardiaceae bacterium]|jgi:molecular chaperone DnaK